MTSKALYLFEAQGVGLGISWTQKALKSWDLQLHEAFALPGGKFLFMAFGDGDPSSRDGFLKMSDRTLVMAQPHPSLIQGLLHLQPQPATGAAGVVVLEGKSPLDLLGSVQNHLESGLFELYDLNLGRGQAGYAVGLLVFREPASTIKVQLPATVTRTVVDEIHPSWRDGYLI